MQVGMALQPSVIYIGDCEKMFKKKIPKTDPVSIHYVIDSCHLQCDSGKSSSFVLAIASLRLLNS